MSRVVDLPDKLFFKIGEVAELVGVKPHVLRYWEQEFPALRPRKTRGAHRHFSRKDVELAMLIRRLLHDEGYTVPGAKKRLRELGFHARTSPSEPRAAREVALRAELLAVRALLADLITTIEHEETPAPAARPAQVTIEKIVPAPVPRR